MRIRMAPRTISAEVAWALTGFEQLLFNDRIETNQVDGNLFAHSGADELWLVLHGTREGFEGFVPQLRVYVGTTPNTRHESKICQISSLHPDLMVAALNRIPAFHCVLIARRDADEPKVKNALRQLDEWIRLVGPSAK